MEITREDLELMDAIDHRLQRLRDYCLPNGSRCLDGLPSTNDTARESLASFNNKLHEYDSSSGKQVRMHPGLRDTLLYYMKESDDHLAAAEKASRYKYPRLYDQLAAFLQKIGMDVPADVPPPTPYFQGRMDAVEEMRLFKTYFDAKKDGAVFANNTRSSGMVEDEQGKAEALVTPTSSLAMVHFDEPRLQDLLKRENPILAMDFTPSSSVVADAMAVISVQDAAIVSRVFMEGRKTRHGEWGGVEMTTPASGPFGLDWSSQFGELSLVGGSYLNSLWQEMKTSVRKASKVAGSPDELITSMNRRDSQNRFVGTTVKKLDAKRNVKLLPSAVPAADVEVLTEVAYHMERLGQRALDLKLDDNESGRLTGVQLAVGELSRWAKDKDRFDSCFTAEHGKQALYLLNKTDRTLEGKFKEVLERLGVEPFRDDVPPIDRPLITVASKVSGSQFSGRG